MPLERRPIYCDITHSIAITATEHESDLKLTSQQTPHTSL